MIKNIVVDKVINPSFLKVRYKIQKRDNGITIKRLLAVKVTFEELEGYSVVQTQTKVFSSKESKRLGRDDVENFFRNYGRLVMHNGFRDKVIDDELIGKEN